MKTEEIQTIHDALERARARAVEETAIATKNRVAQAEKLARQVALQFGKDIFDSLRMWEGFELPQNFGFAEDLEHFLKMFETASNPSVTPYHENLCRQTGNTILHRLGRASEVSEYRKALKAGSPLPKFENSDLHSDLLKYHPLLKEFHKPGE